MLLLSLVLIGRASTAGGLAIVAALAAEWGTEPWGRGRVTWCRLIPGPSGPGAADAWPRTFGPDLDERSASGAELEAEP